MDFVAVFLSLVILAVLVLYFILILSIKKASKPKYLKIKDSTYSDIRINRKKSKNNVSKILGKIDYPVSSRDLIKFAENQGASPDTLTILEKLPDHIYENANQILQKV